MNKFNKLFYTGIIITTMFILITLMIIIMYVKYKLNETPVYTKPIKIEQHIIIRDTVYIERNKVKKYHKSPVVQPTVEVKQIIDTTKTQ